MRLKNHFVTSNTMKSLLIATFVMLIGVVFASQSSFATDMVDKDGIFYSDFASAEETEAVSLEVNAKIGEEGFILMKNQDNTLPFTEVQRISVLGRNSVDLAYGGGGSGGGNTDSAVKLFDSLEAAGFTINPTLVDFYEASPLNRSVPGLRGGDARVAEVPIEEYNDLVYESFGMYNDAALVVITRSGSEGGDSDTDTLQDPNDPTRHYLELTEDEEDVIALAKANFDTIVVIVNNSAPVELGALENDPEIDGIVWIGHPGENAIMALGGILNGTINPSGRTADIYAADYTLDPTWQNFGDMSQHNVTLGDDPDTADVVEEWYFADNAAASFRDWEGDLFNADNDVNLWSRYDTHGGNVVMYEEGIYIGYRYYETRGWEEDNFAADGWYDTNVVYPFGYGLSYTTFDWTVTDTSFVDGAVLAEDAVFTVTVEVLNTGDMAGKDVVQLYVNAPYTLNGIEKSYVELAGFQKTALLQPGQAQEVTIEVHLQDLASYDYDDANGNGFMGYELDEGTYNLFVSQNSHDVVDTVTFDVDVDGYQYTTDRYTGNVVENVFTDTMFESRPFGAMLPVEAEAAAQWTEMSRADFAGTFPSYFEYGTKLSQDSEWIDIMTNIFKLADYEEPGFPNSYTEADVIAMGIDQEDEASPAERALALTLDDMVGIPKDDPQWDTFLTQLKYSELLEVIRQGGYSTAALEVVDKDRARDSDGPASLGGIYWASEVTIAATWNLDIAYQMGRMIGNEALWANIQGWYGPAMNTHRSVFGGRNFEYYSEDGFLAGKMAASVIRGAQDKGIYVYAKHFALNEQETERQALMTFATEQAIREIYLPVFQMAVQEGGAKGIMSSFNRIGLTDSSQNYGLLTTILRDEWGFDGAIVTDYYYGASAADYYMNLQGMWWAGNNIPLNTGNLNVVEGFWSDEAGTVVWYEDFWAETGTVLVSTEDLAADESLYSDGDLYYQSTSDTYYQFSPSRWGGWIPAAWNEVSVATAVIADPNGGDFYVDETDMSINTFVAVDNDPNVDYSSAAVYESYSAWVNVRNMAKDIFYVAANSSVVTNTIDLSGYNNTTDFRGNPILELEYDRNADIDYDILQGDTIAANRFEVFISGGELPDGLELSEDGVLEGSIAEAGDFEFDVTLAAEGWIQTELAVTITVNMLDTDVDTCDPGYHVEGYECVQDDVPVVTCLDLPGYVYDVATQTCSIDPDHEWTEAEIQTLIDDAIADIVLPEDWTEAEIQGLIDTAIAAIPDPDLWTEAEIQALIDTAIAAIPAEWTETQIQALIDAAIAAIVLPEDWTEAEIQAVFTAAFAEVDLPEDWTEAEIQALIDGAVTDFITSADAQTLIDDSLPEDTGCGSSLNLGTSILLITSVLGGAVLFFVRKRY